MIMAVIVELNVGISYGRCYSFSANLVFHLCDFLNIPIKLYISVIRVTTSQLQGK
jgi:hypothetical protein